MHTVFTQDAAGVVQFVRAHHKTAWQNTNRAFKNAHIYVQFKAVYTLVLKHGAGERYQCYVVGTQKLFHVFDVSTPAPL